MRTRLTFFTAPRSTTIHCGSEYALSQRMPALLSKAFEGVPELAVVTRFVAVVRSTLAQEPPVVPAVPVVPPVPAVPVVPPVPAVPVVPAEPVDPVVPAEPVVQEPS
jgi:hypothetical protein